MKEEIDQDGLEPSTCRLSIGRSTNWATGQTFYIAVLMAGLAINALGGIRTHDLGIKNPLL